MPRLDNTQLEALRSSYYKAMGGTAVDLSGPTDRVTLPTKESFELLSETPAWADIESRLSISGKLYLYAGEFLTLLPPGERTDALIDNFSHWLLSPRCLLLRKTYASWDHGTALRLDAFQMLAGPHGDRLSAVAGRLHTSDLAWASDTGNIRMNNHGLFLVRSLLFARAHQQGPVTEPSALDRAISARLPEIIDYVYGDDGWCGENSPMYDRVWINLLRGLMRDFQSELDALNLSERLSAILAAADLTSRAQILPTGHYVPRGDTPRQQTKLVAAQGVHFSQRVGLWVYHRGGLYAMVTGGHVSITHKHVDETQLLLNFRGVDFFMDGGYHSYEYGDARIPALKSPIGHSVLDLDGLGPLPPWTAYAAAKPRVTGSMPVANEDEVSVTKTIDGKQRLRRSVHIDGLRLQVTDSWELSESCPVVSRFLLSNTCEVAHAGRRVHLRRLGQSLTMVFDRDVEVTITSAETKAPYRGWFSIKANVLNEGKCLEIRPLNPGSRGTLSFTIDAGDDPASAIEAQRALESAQEENSLGEPIHPAPQIYVQGRGQGALTVAAVAKQLGMLAGVMDPNASAGSELFGAPVVSVLPESGEACVVGTLRDAVEVDQLARFGATWNMSEWDPSRFALWQMMLERLSAVDYYRAANSLHSLGLKMGADFLTQELFRRFNCRIPASAATGKNFRLGYSGIGVVIHNNSIIGDNVTVAQNVTLGGRNRRLGAPRVGNSVYFGANSLFLGGSIGDGAIVGAGAVVLEPVPANAVVAGNPARIVRMR